MEIVKLFEPCFKEYERLDKPVKYTEEFLRELASKVNKTNLVNEEHFAETIGEVSSFKFTDGALFGVVNTEQATDNLGYSPYIDCSLEDNEDYWLAINPTGITDVALTSSPRISVSLPNTSGGSNMGEENNNETVKILNNQVKTLNNELAIANNKLKANKEKLDKIDEMEKELTELREWKETNSKIIEEQKPIIEKYKQFQDNKKEELIKKLSNDNEEIKAKLQDKSLEELETQLELLGLHHHDQNPKGISSNNAQGLNKGDGVTDEEAEQTARKEAVEGMFGDLFTKEE